MYRFMKGYQLRPAWLINVIISFNLIYQSQWTDLITFYNIASVTDQDEPSQMYSFIKSYQLRPVWLINVFISFLILFINHTGRSW
jgi:hypothetical protein